MHQASKPLDQRARELLGERTLKAGPGPGTLYISGSKPGTWYVLDLNHTPPDCSCPDFTYRAAEEGRPCKHLAFFKMLAETLREAGIRL